MKWQYDFFTQCMGQIFIMPLKYCFLFINNKLPFGLDPCQVIYCMQCPPKGHRDKTRVQMPAKMFPHLKLLCWLFVGPTLGLDTKQRNSFLIKFGIFYNKSKILTILFKVKYE